MTFSPSENAETLMAWARALMIRTHTSSVSIMNQHRVDPSTREVVGTLKLGDLRSCSVVFHPLNDYSLSCPLQVTILGVENHWRSYILHYSHPSRSQILQKIFILYQHQPGQLLAFFQETQRALKTCSNSLKQLSKGEGRVIKNPWLK